MHSCLWAPIGGRSSSSSLAWCRAQLMKQRHFAEPQSPAARPHRTRCIAPGLRRRSQTTATATATARTGRCPIARADPIRRRRGSSCTSGCALPAEEAARPNERGASKHAARGRSAAQRRVAGTAVVKVSRAIAPESSASAAHQSSSSSAPLRALQRSSHWPQRRLGSGSGDESCKCSSLLKVFFIAPRQPITGAMKT